MKSPGRTPYEIKIADAETWFAQFGSGFRGRDGDGHWHDHRFPGATEWLLCVHCGTSNFVGVEDSACPYCGQGDTVGCGWVCCV